LLQRVLPGDAASDEDIGDTLDVALAGLLGVVNSGGAERLSENCGEKFTAYLEQKRSENHL
nr:hypothetical protein [Armatimonadota bacterium]